MGYNWETKKFFEGLKTNYNWEARIRYELVEGEQIFAYNDQVRCFFGGAPVSQIEDININLFGVSLPACIALTNKRIIVITYKDIERTLYFSSVLYLFERKRQKSKPNWPYQAKLVLLGGLTLILETYDEEALSKLLKEAYFRFNIKDFDYGAIAAILEKQRQSESTSHDDYYEKKKENT